MKDERIEADIGEPLLEEFLFENHDQSVIELVKDYIEVRLE